MEICRVELPWNVRCGVDLKSSSSLKGVSNLGLNLPSGWDTSFFSRVLPASNSVIPAPRAAVDATRNCRRLSPFRLDIAPPNLRLSMIWLNLRTKQKEFSTSYRSNESTTRLIFALSRVPGGVKKFRGVRHEALRMLHAYKDLNCRPTALSRR